MRAFFALLVMIVFSAAQAQNCALQILPEMQCVSVVPGYTSCTVNVLKYDDRDNIPPRMLFGTGLSCNGGIHNLAVYTHALKSFYYPYDATVIEMYELFESLRIIYGQQDSISATQEIANGLRGQLEIFKSWSQYDSETGRFGILDGIVHPPNVYAPAQDLNNMLFILWYYEHFETSSVSNWEQFE